MSDYYQITGTVGTNEVKLFVQPYYGWISGKIEWITNTGTHPIAPIVIDPDARGQTSIVYFKDGTNTGLTYDPTNNVWVGVPSKADPTTLNDRPMCSIMLVACVLGFITVLIFKAILGRTTR